MHVVTAMSGGGPAYIFLMIETLAKAGMAGWPPGERIAWPMARSDGGRQCGALAAASEEPAATLRKNVTSPGGTTQAALEVLDGRRRPFNRCSIEPCVRPPNAPGELA